MILGVVLPVRNREEIAMSEKKIEFTFNSALSGVNPVSGAWLEDEHKTMAKGVRAHIMSQPSGDGVCGMFIARYGMSVSYISEATSAAEVIDAVKEAVNWAAANMERAFPLRDDKTPGVTVDTRLPKKTDKVQITATLTTNLYAYPTSDDDGKALRSEFAAKLVRLDGVRGYVVYLDGVQLTIDTTTTSVAEAKAHIENLLKACASEPASEFLPFVKDQPIVIDWDVRNIMQ